MKDIPTREVITAALKLNTAPKRAVEVTLVAVVYALKTLEVSLTPRKVFTVAGTPK
jgi:hypothetical protein